MKPRVIGLLLLLFRFAEAQTPLLQITFPAQNDTVKGNRVRLSGFTESGAVVSINGKRVPLTPQASFVARVDLSEGLNTILVEAQKNGAESVQNLSVYRPPSAKSLPEKPTAIDLDGCAPRRDVWVSVGDYLDVQLKGSPNGVAAFSIDRYLKHLPMVEIDTALTDGIFGIYRGTLRITSELPVDKPLAIEGELLGADGRKKKLVIGRLFVLSPHVPLIGRIKQTVTVYSAAEGYVPWLRLPAGIDLHIVGKRNSRYQVRFSATKQGYIEEDGIELLPAGTPMPSLAVGAPSLVQDKNWIRLIYPADRLPAFWIDKDPVLNRLDLYLFGTRQASHWVTFPNGESDLAALVFGQEDNTFRTTVVLRTKRVWGYKAEYRDGAVVFSIRRPPVINSQNPLQGLVIAVDAGHGGQDRGAVSPLGRLEKEVNLMWAESLAAKLRSNGATVVMTRREDVEVSLPERIRLAEEAEAHIFFSLHNNSVPATGNPAAEGTSVYFTTPQSRDLAWAIYPYLVKQGLAPFGRVYNAYYVTQSTAFLSVLIEGGFLSNPKEELKLADPVFIDRLSQAICEGLTDFLLTGEK
ncbi:MAG: N-acetylmuramoyl-L-alanine amidase [candidate division KSB1 bacterium]|nr:N-acetylmuramoyl-L-alanine amidase [candidate division KSB1 bacterium]